MIKYESKYSDELMHHGIIKQQWGVRHGPPYPLSKAKHNAVINREKISLSETQGKKQKFDSGLTNRLDDMVSPTLPFTTIDGVQTFPPVASVIRDMEKGEYDEGEYGKQKVGDQLRSILKRETSGFDGVVDDVNPDYGEIGTTNNCTMCGAAMELRGKGYDVTARKSFGGASAGSFTKWFKGAQNEQCDTLDEMKRDIENEEDGASGVLQGFYGRGLGSGDGGHTLHWRKEKGKIIIADGQDHTEGDWDFMVNKYGFSNNGCIRTRLDNCDPNWDELAKDGVIDCGKKEFRGVYKEEIHPSNSENYDSWYEKNKKDFETKSAINYGQQPMVDKSDRWYKRASKWLE